MPGNEPEGACGWVGLIRDIGRSNGRGGSGHTPEQHLLLLSRDPLLVREFLLRQEPAHDAPRSTPLAAESSIALARDILGKGRLEHTVMGRQARPRHQHESLQEAPDPPVVFQPSGRDRVEAVDHDAPAPLGDSTRPGISGPYATMAAMVLAVLLIWLLVRLVPV
jgi:hypothetical protein